VRAGAAAVILLILPAQSASAVHPLEATLDFFGFVQDDDGGQALKAEGMRYVGARATARFILDATTDLETSVATSFLSNESAADLPGIDAITGASPRLLALDVSAGLSARRGEVWTLRPALVYHHQKGYVSEGVDIVVDRDLAGGDATLTAALNVRVAFLALETFRGRDAGTELAGTNALSVSWRQNVSTTLVTQVGAQYVRQDGYLGDSYNYVVLTSGGDPVAVTDETLPRVRQRGQLNGRVRWSLRPDAAAGADASWYFDDWAVRHFAFEPSLTWPLPGRGRVRGWWRVSNQEAAEHFRTEIQALGRFQTQDSDLGSFVTHSAGVVLVLPRGARARADEMELTLYGFTRDDGIRALGASTGVRRRW
jgi:hypothetical protein